MTETLQTRKPERFIMQSLTSQLGDLALRCCAPVAMYGLLRTEGYVGALTLDEFIDGLDIEGMTTASRDWSRPALSRVARRYGASVISWQLGAGGFNRELMKQAGYIDKPSEEEFYLEHIHGRSVEEIVRGGNPTMVTMKPGFGTEENRNIHAVTIQEWGETVTVIDPDGRNADDCYLPDKVIKYIYEFGAGTVVLPWESA